MSIYFFNLSFFKKKPISNIKAESNLTSQSTEVPQTTPQTKLNIPILIYHYVEVVTDKNDFLRENLNIHPTTFEKQVQTLLDAGYTFIFPSELPTKIQYNDAGKYVILSFDDGYESFFTQTYPILKKNQVKSVNYIIYNSIGKLNYMNDFQIKQLAREGLVEIGSHTLSHADLTSLKLPQAAKEILNSKTNLENTFQIQVNSFYYPYGFYNNQIAELVQKAGYTNAVTTEKGVFHTQEDLFNLKRIRPGYKTGEELLKIITN